MNHLQNIASRQRKSRVRDALFATFIALAALASIATVSQVVVATSMAQAR
jgi:hypothetical protein